MSFMSMPKLLSPTLGGDSVALNDGKKLYNDLEDLRRSLAMDDHDEDQVYDDDGHDETQYADLAPAEHEWYHGVMDRTVAERLLESKPPGTYLVRESEGRPGSYSLSYIGRAGFDHFRIVCAYGQYYIGGRQFPSLRDLIGYYTSISYILECENLQNPLSPELRSIELQQDPHEGRPWFFSALSKHYATSYAQTHGNIGSFLIRPSEAQGDYSLMVHVGDGTVQRYRVRQDHGMYYIGGKSYNSLDDIIAHYRQCQISPNVYLLNPFRKTEEYIMLEGGGAKSHPSSASSKAGHLTIKMESSKKWKEFYFRVLVSERQLLYFERENSSHPKGLIDLDFSYLYNVHESLHGRSNCFQLVIRSFGEVSSFFLCCQSQEDKEEWMKVLEPLCLNAECPDNQKGSHMEMCNIRLTVLDTQRFPKNCNRAYCLISLNDVSVAKTACLEGSSSAPSLAWDEDFVFGGLNKEICTLAVVVLNKHKRAKDSVVGKVSVDLTQLPNRTTTEEWYDLKPVDKSSKSKLSLGTLRLRVKYQCDVILPEVEYEPLRDRLVANNMEAVACLGEVIKDRRSLVGSLIRIFSDCPVGMQLLLSNLTKKEINAHDDPATLFRSNSVASSALDEYMKSVAMPFLHATVKEVVTGIVNTDPHCELDPNRLEKGEDAEQNLENLTKLVDEILSCVFASGFAIDKTLREVFFTLRISVVERYPDNVAVKTRVVAGFFFLRFICLALVHPRLFNLVTNHPSDRAMRTLTLVAKVLQNLANLIGFGAKEPYMAPVNSLLGRHQPGLIAFVERISLASEKEEASCRLQINSTTHREFANLASVAMDYLPDMKKLSQSTKPTAPIFGELVDILEKLTKAY